jgi:hypothetical protein
MLPSSSTTKVISQMKNILNMRRNHKDMSRYFLYLGLIFSNNISSFIFFILPLERPPKEMEIILYKSNCILYLPPPLWMYHAPCSRIHGSITGELFKGRGYESIPPI